MTLEDTLFNQFNAFQVGNSSKAIIWNYDIFGLDGGRTKQMADFMADHGDDIIFCLTMPASQTETHNGLLTILVSYIVVVIFEFVTTYSIDLM